MELTYGLVSYRLTQGRNPKTPMSQLLVDASRIHAVLRAVDEQRDPAYASRTCPAVTNITPEDVKDALEFAHSLDFEHEIYFLGANITHMYVRRYVVPDDDDVHKLVAGAFAIAIKLVRGFSEGSAASADVGGMWNADETDVEFWETNIIGLLSLGSRDLIVSLAKPTPYTFATALLETVYPNTDALNQDFGRILRNWLTHATSCHLLYCSHENALIAAAAIACTLAADPGDAFFTACGHERAAVIALSQALGATGTPLDELPQWIPPLMPPPPPPLNDPICVDAFESAPTMFQQCYTPVQTYDDDLGSTKTVVLGEGTYGKVKKYTDNVTGAYVAAKKTKTAAYGPADIVHELAFLTLMDTHPNVVTLLGVYEKGDTLRIVYEFCPMSLWDWLADANTTPAVKIAWAPHIIAHIVHGMHHIHGYGLVHGDLKPANILLTSNLTAKIADVGMTTFAPLDPSFVLDVRGTLDYESPESCVYVGDSTIFRSQPMDAWAIGAIAAEFFAAAPIMQGNTPEEHMLAIEVICGSPVAGTMPEIEAMTIGNMQGSLYLKTLLNPTTHPDATDFVLRLLVWNATARMTTAEAEQHPFVTALPARPTFPASALPGSGGSYPSSPGAALASSMAYGGTTTSASPRGQKHPRGSSSASPREQKHPRGASSVDRAAIGYAFKMLRNARRPRDL